MTTAPPAGHSAWPTPTGTVQFLVNNAPVGSPVTLNSSGVATYTYVTSCSTLGQQNITASYSGDGTYAGSVGPVLTADGANADDATARLETSPLIVTVSAELVPQLHSFAQA